MDAATGAVQIEIDPTDLRPSEFGALIGTHARPEDGWARQNDARFKALVAEMIDVDSAAAAREMAEP